MTASEKGEDRPKSKTKPVFFDPLFQLTAVPAVTQKGAFPFAFGVLGVAEASEAVRLISTVHGVEADPHVFSAVHMDCGLGSEQRYFSGPRICSCATVKKERTRTIANAARCWGARMHRVFIVVFPRPSSRQAFPASRVRPRASMDSLGGHTATAPAYR